MANKAEYELVPDVETGVIPEPEVDPRETYPQADALQAKLLGYLDEVIKLPNPQVQLPYIQARQVEGAPASFAELIESIKIPTFVFLASAAAAVGVVASDSALAQLIFPYCACVAAFAATVPSLTQRFTKQSNRAFETIDTTEASLNGKVDAVTFKVNLVVDRIQEMLKEVLEPIRPKLDMATKAEVVLKKFDDSIDIPDPTDMEEELDGCADEVEEKMEAVKELINFRKMIPICFRSKENFTKYAIYPVLAIFLVMQLMGVYQSSHMEAADNVDQETDVQMRRFLRGTVKIQVRKLVQNMASNKVEAITESIESSWNGTSSTIDEALESSSWYPVWVSIQVYITALMQLVIGYLITQAAVVAGVLNKTIIRPLNEYANRAIKTTGATEVFDKYLTTKLQDLREKMLKLINDIAKVDKALEKARSVQKGSAVAKNAASILNPKKSGSFLKSLPGSPFGKKK
jgi:hypothetical protein